MRVHIPKRTVGAAPFWLTAASVKEYARLVDTEFESVNADAYAAAQEKPDQWGLAMGTSWQTFYQAWKEHLAHVVDWADSTLSFGPGQEWNVTEDYEKGAMGWQARIAELRGKPPSGKPIAPPTTPSDLTPSPATLIVAGIGAAAILVIALKR